MRRIWTSSQLESRHEPEPRSNVSSGLCTPGSIRMRYLISRESRLLRSTTKSTVRLVDRSILFRNAWRRRPDRLRRAINDKVGPQVLAVFERPDLRALFDEEIERVVDRHVGDDVDLDLQFVDEVGKDVAGEPVAVRILLVVHEMAGGRHFQRMRDDPGPAVGRGPQPDDLRPERDRPVIEVMRQVMDGGSDRHRRKRTLRDRKTLS